MSVCAESEGSSGGGDVVVAVVVLVVLVVAAVVLVAAVVMEAVRYMVCRSSSFTQSTSSETVKNKQK